MDRSLILKGWTGGNPSLIYGTLCVYPRCVYPMCTQGTRQLPHLGQTILVVGSHWVTNITINFATKFATRNKLGLIPIFATKYFQLSNLQM